MHRWIWAGTTDVWIKTFDVSGTSVDWTTNSATSCVITNDDDSTTLTGTSGVGVSHNLDVSVLLTITCQGANLPATAQAVVP